MARLEERLGMVVKGEGLDSLLASMRGAIPPQLSTEGFFMTKITKGKVRIEEGD